MSNSSRPSAPLVSIVIPVFNGGRYLVEAIDSALAQTWHNTEVIVVDDGSDDNGETARICAEYGKRIRYFYKINGGVATALNYAIQVMRGEYFSWLSHDDLYRPDRIATMVEAQRDFDGATSSGQSVISLSDFETIDQHGHLERSRRQRSAWTRGIDIAAIHWPIYGCGLLIPRACFERAGMFHPGLATTQDADMWLRMRRVARYVPIPVITVARRMHEQQGSQAPWHRRGTCFHQLSILDRLDSGFIPNPFSSRIEGYRKMLKRPLMKSRPGVESNCLLRLECALEKLPAGHQGRSKEDAMGLEQEAGVNAGQSYTELRALFKRPGSAPGVLTLFCAYAWRPLFWCIQAFELPGHRFGRSLLSLKDHWRGRSATNTIIARLGRYRGLMTFLNKTVWRFSSCKEVARLRLLRLHGLTASFDFEWYLRAYPDVRKAGIDPLMHYLCSGHWAGRDPNPGFNTSRYLATHADVAAARWHAAQHYALWGRFESRKVERSSHVEYSESVRQIEADSALLIVCPFAVGEGARLTDNLAAQLQRNIRTLILQKGTEGYYRLRDAASDEFLSDIFLSPKDIASHLGELQFCRMLILADIDSEANLTGLSGLMSLPYDLVHMPRNDGVGNTMSLSEYDVLVGNAENHYALSVDMASQVCELSGIKEVRVVALPDPGRLGCLRPWLRNTEPGDCCRIALFGVLTEDDGLAILLEVLSIVHRYDLPFVFLHYGTVKGEIPGHLQNRFHNIQVYNERQLTDVVCAFNPHLAWIPYRKPSNAVFPLADAAMSGLAVAAVKSLDARNYLAGRRLSWLLPAKSGARDWLSLFYRIYTSSDPDPWTPRYPLEGFPARDKALSELVLASISSCQTTKFTHAE